jgi:hypothetical protein
MCKLFSINVPLYVKRRSFSKKRCAFKEWFIEVESFYNLQFTIYRRNFLLFVTGMEIKATKWSEFYE